MSITLVDSYSTRIFSGGTLTMTHGMTILEDDVLVAIVNNNGTSVASGLDGFTAQTPITFATSTLDVMHKVAGASEASSYTFTYPESTRRSVSLLQLRGVNTTTPFDVAPLVANLGEGTSTTATAPTITTTTDGAYGVFFVGCDTGSLSNFSAFTNSYVQETHQINGNSQTVAVRSIATAGAVGAAATTIDASREWGAIQFAMMDAAASTGLTIDSTDASMQRDTNWQMVVSNPSTAPTTLNTTLTNDTTILTPSSVTGSGPYTLTFPVGDVDKQVDATGYPWTLTVDLETAVTANIPLTIQAGYTLVDLVSPDTTNASLLFGADRDAPVTGDHLEYTVTSTLDDTVELNVAASGVWTITNVDNWVTDITVSRRVVQVDGSIGAEAVVTLEAATGVAVVKRYTLFDFGTVLPLGNANSINTTNVGQKVANAIDTDGSSTGISLSVAEEFDGQSDNTVDFPNGNPWSAENNIARDCVFTNGVGNGSIVLSGLNDSLVYTIELASYRTGSGDQYTDFTINGTTQTVFSKGDTSVGGTTSFDVTPSSGSITIDVNESDGYTVGYLNAMRLSWPISSLGLGVVTDIVTVMVTGLVTDMVN